MITEAYAFNGNTIVMVIQMMPTITEVLNTCSNGQPESPGHYLLAQERLC